MKITAQEEYGLRILLRIVRCQDNNGLSIPQLSEAEELSTHYVAKLTRILRLEGFINSTPGNKGGYVLARPANEIVINEVLQALGGVLYDSQFCNLHVGIGKLCTNSVDCSARSLWQIVQYTLDSLLNKITLLDLITPTNNSTVLLENILQQNLERMSLRPIDNE